jgi:hypothetical protein
MRVTCRRPSKDELPRTLVQRISIQVAPVERPQFPRGAAHNLKLAKLCAGFSFLRHGHFPFRVMRKSYHLNSGENLFAIRRCMNTPVLALL